VFGIQVRDRSGIRDIFVDADNPFKTVEEAETWLVNNGWISYQIPGYFKDGMIATVVPYRTTRDVSEIQKLIVPDRTVKPTALNAPKKGKDK